MYKFVDTLPNKDESVRFSSESVAINGVALESEFSTFKTLTVTGRELLAKTISTQIVGNSIGDFKSNNRLPSRTISIKYQLQSKTALEFRQQFYKFNAILNQGEVKLSFNDDPNVYYVGEFDSAEIPLEGKLNVISKLTFHCYQPFAYANQETPFEIDGDTITIQNGGTYPTPVNFDIENQSDNGFIGVVNSDAIIQIGNPDEVDGFDYTNQDSLVFNSFATKAELDSWSLNVVQPNYPYNKVLAGSFGVKQGTNSDWMAYPTSFGDAGVKTMWYGPSMYKPFAKNSAGESSVSNFQLTSLIQSIARKNNSMGVQELTVIDEDGAPLCGFYFRKITKASMNVSLYMFVGNTIVQKWEGASVKWVKDFLGNISVVKEDDNFTFTLNNLTNNAKGTYHYFDKVLGAKKAKGVVYWNGIQSKIAAIDMQLFFVRVNSATQGWSNSKNLFMGGDQIRIDCTDKVVWPYLNNDLILDVMDRGSRPILAPPGESVVTVTKSSFAAPVKVTAKIRERWV